MSKKGSWVQGNLPTDNLIGYNGKQRYLSYRSSWEYKAIKIIINLVKLGKVKSWNSEETVIEYHYSLDKDPHKKRRYFMDFTLEMSSGAIILVEVKPKSQAAKIVDNQIVDYKPPRKSKNPKTQQNNIETYLKNSDKWNTTCALCQEKTRSTGIPHKFVIWDENTLKI